MKVLHLPLAGGLELAALSANQRCLSRGLEPQTGEAPLMRRARLLMFCALALALPVPSFSQSPSTAAVMDPPPATLSRSEEHTSELQSHLNLVCRLLLEKKKD